MDLYCKSQVIARFEPERHKSIDATCSLHPCKAPEMNSLFSEYMTCKQAYGYHGIPSSSKGIHWEANCSWYCKHSSIIS